MMRKVLSIILLLLLGTCLYAQQHTVKGTILDQEGIPVIGMAVLEQGTRNGVSTDANGAYSITVSKSTATLRFEAIGYEPKSENIAQRAVIDVIVEESKLSLEASVAIGYGTVRKKDLTTAVATVSTDDIRLRPISEASGFIQGKVAGVTVQQTSGLPGAGMTVRVRGASSLSTSNDPLYVVDGVPVGTGNYAIAFLSPGDIEDMQILKDASSAAIYGSRAANGVILITTKQGKRSRGPQINFSSSIGIANVTRTYDVLNVDQYRELMEEIGGPTIPEGIKDETDWFKETFRPAISQNYQISASNANENSRYYLSAGYTDEKGIISSAYNKRYNFKVNNEIDLFNWISVGSNLAYSHYKGNGIISGTGSNRAGVVLSVINTPTYAKPFSEKEGEEGWYWTDFYGVNINTPAENVARTKDNYTQTDRLLLTGYATIKFSPHLHFKSTVTMDRRWVHGFYFLDPYAISYGRTQHGEVSSERSDDRRMVYDNILTYSNTWGGKHNFEAMAGTSATTSLWENLSGSRNYLNPELSGKIFGLNAGNKGGLRGQGQGYAEWAIMSYLARVSYNFDSRYYLTANVRTDGSSKLAPENRWGIFPSVSAAWRISSEEFMQDISWLDDLKIRAGWGQQGNQEGLGDYAWVQDYSTNYYDWTQTSYADAVPTVGGNTNIGNRELTWETTTQSNIGIDLSMFDRRVNVTLDAYYKYTTNLLMSVPLPAPYPSIYRNEGEMSNAGLELAISSDNLRGRELKWTTDFSISTNRNRLEKLSLQQVYYYTTTSEFLSENIVRMTPGHSLSKFWGLKALGVDPETGMIMYEDLNKDGKINVADKQYIGDANPLFTAGMTNTFSWRGINFSFLLTSSVGNDIYNASKLEMVSMSNGFNQITDVLKRWKVPGQITDIPKSNELDNLKASTRWVEDGSYLKVRNITLSYDITSPRLKAAHISRIQPYITLDNMITLTKYSGYDPEMSQYTSATSMGVDWGTYPCVKTVLFGINIDF